MNMPTHIIAKPIDVDTDAATGMCCSGAFDMGRPGQRDRLRTDPDR